LKISVVCKQFTFYGDPSVPRRVVLFSFCQNVFCLHFDKTKIKQLSVTLTGHRTFW